MVGSAQAAVIQRGAGLGVGLRLCVFNSSLKSDNYDPSSVQGESRSQGLKAFKFTKDPEVALFL